MNVGTGKNFRDAKKFEKVQKALTTIAGQYAVGVKTKKSVAQFKTRQGMTVALKVTLRGERMYEFLDRLIAVALPRVRDFRGVNDKSFDGRGNYTLGIKEQIIFPEIDIDKVNNISGLDITFVTSAKTDKEAFALLKHMGMPFKNQNNA